MIYALSLATENFAEIDDSGLQAGADAVTHAVTVRDICPVTLRALMTLQASLRRQLDARQRRVAAIDLTRYFATSPIDLSPAAAETTSPQVPPAAGSGGSGGSKIRRPTPPTKPSGPAGASPIFSLPALALDVDAF